MSAQTAWRGIQEKTNSADLAAPSECVVRELLESFPMKRQEFLSAMDNLLELPAGTLTGAEPLDDVENWTSLAMVEYIALADTNDVKLTPRQIRDCETVDDLARLAKVE
jgi:acyl carrier protein